ncbi:cytochrome P450 [Rhizodiscina lignyota]|uniref:Cytochrome P450 n=1 Tax=Rhizodiscina lignyota TaxID=1504668 RepID=A0A9P4IMG3_9PEZI|nr:cytochrome P450 [Rhizodiscina lignyota]
MIIEEVLGAVLDNWFLVPIFLVSFYVLYNRYGYGLNRYPGPFLASVTDLWQVYAASNYGRHFLIDLHEKYGDIVRIAPNKLSFANPTAIKDMLGPGKDFRKSGFYYVSAATAKGRASPSLFSTLDKDYHDRIKRCVNQAFSTTSLVNYEPYVNHVITLFLEQMHARFANKPGSEGIFNLVRWLHFYALDVIGEVVYGKSYGFLESGTDVGNMAADTQDMLDYAYLAGQAPWVDRLFKKNPITMWLTRRGFIGSHINPAVASAMKAQSARGLGDAKPEEKDLENAKDDGSHEDLMDQFIKAKHEHPDMLGDREILMLGISMVLAGSDTTAWTLSAFFYYVLRTPGVYSKLVKEIRDAGATGLFPYTQTQKMPYLDACIKETFRMHPAGRFGSERVVPREGATICDEHIPGGSVVVINAWPIHRRRDIWGDDVETFRPERWLENEERAKRMYSMLSQFGHGNFICIGKNISLLEMYKVTAATLNEFDVELVDPEREWKLLAGNFVRPDRVDVRIRRRQK